MLNVIILVGLVISGVLIMRLAHSLDRYFGNTNSNDMREDSFSS